MEHFSEEKIRRAAVAYCKGQRAGNAANRHLSTEAMIRNYCLAVELWLDFHFDARWLDERYRELFNNKHFAPSLPGLITPEDRVKKCLEYSRAELRYILPDAPQIQAFVRLVRSVQEDAIILNEPKKPYRPHELRSKILHVEGQRVYFQRVYVFRYYLKVEIPYGGLPFFCIRTPKFVEQFDVLVGVHAVTKEDFDFYPVLVSELQEMFRNKNAPWRMYLPGRCPEDKLPEFRKEGLKYLNNVSLFFPSDDDSVPP